MLFICLHKDKSVPHRHLLPHVMEFPRFSATEDLYSKLFYDLLETACLKLLSFLISQI